MKKTIYFIIIFLICILLTACNTYIAGSDVETIEEVPVKHEYKDGKLTSIVDKINSDSVYKIELDMSMKGMDDHQIKVNNFKTQDNSYIAEIEIPMEGEWNLNYTISDKEQSWSYFMTKEFSANNHKENYYININSSPKKILKNTNGNFDIKIYDDNGGVIKNGDELLRFHKLRVNLIRFEVG